MADYVMTIDSDTEDISPPKLAKTSKSKSQEDVDLDPEFVFDVSGDPYIDIPGQQNNLQDFVKKGTKPVCLFPYFLFE